MYLSMKNIKDSKISKISPKKLKEDPKTLEKLDSLESEMKKPVEKMVFTTAMDVLVKDLELLTDRLDCVEQNMSKPTPKESSPVSKHAPISKHAVNLGDLESEYRKPVEKVIFFTAMENLAANVKDLSLRQGEIEKKIHYLYQRDTTNTLLINRLNELINELRP